MKNLAELCLKMFNLKASPQSSPKERRPKLIFGISSLTIYAFILLLFACSGNQPAQEKKETSGSDFLKQEKPKTDYTIINKEAPVVKVELKAMGNTMAEMSFDKDTIKVPAGCTVDFTLENGSMDQSMQHNFVLVTDGAVQEVADGGVKAGIDKGYLPDSDEILIASSLTKPGEKATLKFKAPAKGIYEFVCTYPGHYSKMRGVFIVE